MGRAQQSPSPERRPRSLTPSRPEFDLIACADGAVLCRGSEFRCQAAVVEHFGRDHWFGEDGTVLRSLDGEQAVVIAMIREAATERRSGARNRAP
jgi:hypothetical protein